MVQGPLMYIKLKHNLHKIPLTLNQLSGVAVKKAVAKSLNETRRWIYSKGAAIIRSRVNLPINGSSQGGGGLTPPGIKSLIDINPVRYSKSAPLSSYALKVNTGSKPVSMVHFLSPSKKKPISQAGRAVNKRLPKTLTAKIANGNTTTLKGAFVQRSQGAVQVFRRTESGAIKKQAYRSLWDLIAKDPVAERLTNGARDRYAALIDRNMRFYLDRIKAK